jgi:GxxExxY protein
MTVHGTLGYGFQEDIYHRAMAIEMMRMNLSFYQEAEMPLMYGGHEIGTRRMDFLVENCVMLELKVTDKLKKVHQSHAMNYLEAYNLEIGLLVNFGAPSLEYKQIRPYGWTQDTGL